MGLTYGTINIKMFTSLVGTYAWLGKLGFEPQVPPHPKCLEVSKKIVPLIYEWPGTNGRDPLFTRRNIQILRKDHAIVTRGIRIFGNRASRMDSIRIKDSCLHHS